MDQDDTVYVRFIDARVKRPTQEDLDEAERQHGDWDRMAQWMWAAGRRILREKGA